MKEIIHNSYNLSSDDMTRVVKRVKVLFINDNDEIHYVFPISITTLLEAM